MNIDTVLAFNATVQSLLSGYANIHSGFGSMVDNLDDT